MNSRNQEKQTNENLMKQCAAQTFLEHSRFFQYRIDTVAFMKELLGVSQVTDEDCQDERKIDFSKDQQIGLFELIKDELLNVLPEGIEAIRTHIKYAIEADRDALVDAMDAINNAVGKLSFVQMLAELPHPGECVTLSYRAARGLVQILKNIECDLESVHYALRCAGVNLISDMESDAGSKPH